MKAALFNTIDTKENFLINVAPDLLAILLRDMTTGRNIIWATDNYVQFGADYSAEKEIKREHITGRNGGIIKPRTEKSRAEQQRRVRQKAEVFTPSWICNMQNNLVDEAWFGRKNVFNTEKEKGWEPTIGKIQFPGTDGGTWSDYILSNRLEITCGEAPYLASRYDAVTGEPIAVPCRIGLLDRKLRVAGENTESAEEWKTQALAAVQSVYGFEWQGDNVLLARENLLLTVAEHYEEKFGGTLSERDLLEFAKVIAWNIWQMDGLKFVVPNSCRTEEIAEEDLFERRVILKECEGCKKGDDRKHNGIYCNIMDWKTNEIVRFVDLKKDGV